MHPSSLSGEESGILHSIHVNQSECQDSTTPLRCQELRIVPAHGHSVEHLCARHLFHRVLKPPCSHEKPYIYNLSCVPGTLLGLLPTTAAHVYAGLACPYPVLLA